LHQDDKTTQAWDDHYCLRVSSNLQGLRKFRDPMHSLRGVATLHAPAYQALRRHCRLTRQKTSTPARATAVPEDISAQVSEAAVSWSQHCLTEPLVDQVTGCKVYLLGVCHYAPGQHQQLLEVIQQVQPSCIALDVPPDALPGVLLPYPAWIQTLLDHAGWLDPAAAAAAAAAAAEDGSPAAVAAASIAAAAHSNGNSSSSHVGADDPPMDTAKLLQQRQQQLYRELATLALPDAKIGRDILDPFEGLGYYAAVDYSRSPTHIAMAWQDQGFAPGWELAAAAGAALQQGARLACLDAPLRLQETWVKGLLQKFVVDEQGYAYQPQKDLESLQALVSPALVTWDAELAARSAAEAAAAARPPGVTEESAAINGNGVATSSGTLLGSADERALVRFKISRATAAAALTLDQTAGALTALRRLQPLKFKHAALRELHMSRQLRDVCCRLATAAGVMPSIVAEVAPDTAAGDTTSSSSSSSSGGSGGGVSIGGVSPTAGQPSVGPASGQGQQQQQSQAPVVLALVGRQYVPGMQALWQQPDSALWRDVMPKHFTPTHLTWEAAAQQGGRE
jgi:hypothetical protein